MCFSAQTWQDYRRYVRKFGADIDIHEFVRLYAGRNSSGQAKIPKGMDAAFLDAQSESERQIKSLIDQFNAEQASKLEQELFKQVKRLNDAERSLQTKQTKKALDDQRIAGNKIEQIKSKLSDLQRADIHDRDNRIFPLVYAPVMVWEEGRRVVKPMRYQCRVAGKPASYDRDYSGTYNARRDNLEGFWRGQFGVSHGLIVADAFFENVWKHAAEGRELAPGEKEENAVIEFRPNTGQGMLLACLWSHWADRAGKEPDLLSFALITDNPPPEVLAAGHDRCPIPIKEEHVDAWLNPDPANLAAMYAILDDRERPYYEHRMAA
jgi:putative SOS response-associated peptidase YedK